jgi:cyclopropane fatty-acyl-phospholipid synthase-like methyltransferase
VEQIATVLRSHPDYGKRKLNVVDIGGGKGLLSNLLAETFGEDVVQVQVIDISRSATANGMMRAKRRGLENVRFDAMDATKVDVQSNKDVVVALHACGALSDVGEYDLCV